MQDVTPLNWMCVKDLWCYFVCRFLGSCLTRTQLTVFVLKWVINFNTLRTCSDVQDVKKRKKGKRSKKQSSPSDTD